MWREIVAIVGSARTNRDLAPWDDETVDIWGINEALKFSWMRRADAVFQMHARWSFTRPNNRNDPQHFEWLKQKHPFPIYMQQEWDDIPSSVAYPLQEVLQLTPYPFFTSTVAYAIALAVLYEYKEIRLFGVEMASDSEYFWQRDCVTYWLGIAAGRGIHVVTPPGATLLHDKLYGYEGAKVIERMQFELRVAGLERERDQAKSRLDEASGKVKLLADMYLQDQENEELAGKFQEAQIVERQALVDFAAVAGALSENQKYIIECDQLLRAAGETAQDEKEYAL